MKRIIVMSLVLVGWLQVALAQHNIESIRKAYQDVRKEISLMADNFPEDGIPPEYYHLHVAQNLPGTGPHHENIRMYYGELPSEEEGYPYPPHFLQFVTSKYNFAVREFYEEYLYDDKGRLMFVYAQTPDVDFPKMHEFRFYFDGNRLLRVQVKVAEGLTDFDPKTLKTANFKEVYTGQAVPAEFKAVMSQYQTRAKRFLTMFKGIDDNTYL